MRDQLDLRQDTNYNIIVNKARTLNATVDCYFVTGNTEISFDFSSYTGATLEVQKDYNSSTEVLKFDTSDSSIVLSSGSTFQLIKTASEMNVREGEYVYNMWLKNSTYPLRQFLSGNFIIQNTIRQ